MSLLKKLAGQTVVYGLGYVLSRVLYFLLVNTYLTYKIENPFEYGIYSEMYSYATLLLVVFSYRIDTAFFRFANKKDGPGLQATYWNSFIPLMITTALLLLIGYGLSDAVGNLMSIQSNYIKWFLFIIGFDVLCLLPYAKMRLEGKPGKFIAFRILNIVFTSLLILYFFEFYIPNKGIVSFLPNLFDISRKIDFVFISNLMASGSLFLILSVSSGKISSKVNWQQWKKMFYYSAPLIIVGLANSINQFFAPVLQKYFLGGDMVENLSNAGVYTAALRIAMLISIFTTAFNYAAEPFFFNNANRKDSHHIYGKVCLLFLIVGGVLILLIQYNMNLVQYLAGSNYREALYLVPILLLAYLFLGVYYNVSIWYKLADKTHIGAYISILGVLITLGISVFGLPNFGYATSAIASLLCYITMVIAAYYLGIKYYKIDYPIKRLTRVFLLLILFMAIGFGVDTFIHNPWVSFGLKTIFLALFVGLIYKKEKEIFQELITKS